jgi:hypothetical protein
MAYNINFTPQRAKRDGFLQSPTESYPYNTSNPYIGNDSVGSLYVPNCENNKYQTARLKDYWTNFIANFGVRVEFFSNAYDLKEHNFLYGEDPLSGFHPPRILKAYVEVTNESRLLAKFGIMTENDATLLIPISEFQRVWGTTPPKIGDVWRVMDGACDRPEGQTPKVFQISDKIDTLNPVDFLGGHYVWKLTSKRFDFSYEKNAPEEKEMGGLSDVPFFGQLFPEDKTDETKPYPDKTDNVDEKAKEDFDNSDRDKAYPYGNYLL